MNLDELRSQLREAGRPIQPTVDPIPVIQQRVRRVRQRRAVLAVGALAAAAFFGTNVIDSVRSAALFSEPVATVTSTQRDLQRAQMGLLPDRLQNQERVTLEHIGAASKSVSVVLHPGDEIRFVYACNDGDPEQVELQLTSYPPGNSPIGPTETIPVSACQDSMSTGVTSRELAANWPAGVATITVTMPCRCPDSPEPTLIDSYVAVYRIQ
jgi:hypothetical protein